MPNGFTDISVDNSGSVVHCGGGTTRTRWIRASDPFPLAIWANDPILSEISFPGELGGD